MEEINFEITRESDGAFVAECLTESSFTQADGWKRLRRSVKEAVATFYFECGKLPARIRL